MDVAAIQAYYTEVERIIHHGGSTKETSIRAAFITLINTYARPKGLELVAEVTLKTTSGKTIFLDGTLKDKLRQDWGYYEAKDEADDLDTEVKLKFAKGYPQDNILFEDSREARLYRQGQLVQVCPHTDEKALAHMLQSFVSYERAEVRTFREAIQHFSEDVPRVTETLRTLIKNQEEKSANPRYIATRDKFWELCKESINPLVSLEDIREMMIQHILTADIFNTVFDEPHFHRENNVAKELEGVIGTFFTGDVRRDALGRIQHYYQTINAAAAQIADHHEKQKFLKVLYETFYKSYNPKAADRLGVVYTPNEIVRFMVEGTDALLERHFGRRLEDKGVEILDPATGTGTFICEIIDYLGQTQPGRTKLKYKYEHELHANEVAILPYYIANLNIEFTYKQRMGDYAEFKNLCFVDTLDNIGGMNMGADPNNNLYGSTGKINFGLNEENTSRIRKQNSSKISVIIGNPPYNAKQANYNFQNANRGYSLIDQRIKNTFIALGTAQNQIVMYDMYTRFYRWAMDRLDANQGVIAFITNRSFIDSRSLDGFRKVIEKDFQYAYIIDTKSDVRANPKISGTGYNVFGIQTGVAIMFLVKSDKKLAEAGCRIVYWSMDDFMPKEEKTSWFSMHKLLEDVNLDVLQPDKQSNWINKSDNDWETFLLTASQDAKKNGGRAIFKLFTRGVETARDEWVYDFDKKKLLNKAKLLVSNYNELIDQGKFTINSIIKWSSSLEQSLISGIKGRFKNAYIHSIIFRPYVKVFHYAEKLFNHRLTENHYQILGTGLNLQNSIIQINGMGMEYKMFGVLSTKYLVDIQNMPNGQCLPLYRYDKDGNRHDNITEWAVEQFVTAYAGEGAIAKPSLRPTQAAAKRARLLESLGKPPELETEVPAPKGKWYLTKQDIFHYVYAVLHHPAYREKYALNLKREFPRVPFYADFRQWVSWGQNLMDLHIDYEKEAPYGLTQVELTTPDANNEAQNVLLAKAKLKADKAAGTILLDGYTRLEGVPALAWEYKLGNRSALEWVLDQYKEKTPKDATIREHFNTYRFADYKAHVIDLLQRVCTVSVETQSIIAQMPATVEEALSA